MTALADISRLLAPGLMDVQGKYREAKSEWQGIFVQKVSQLTQERIVKVRYTGPAKVKYEGKALDYDTGPGDRWQYSMETTEAALGYTMTRKAIDDNLYKDSFQPANLGLGQSMRAFWNAQAASVFNLATTVSATLGGDGVALLSTAHPYDGGTWANTSSTPRSLGESSLLNAQTQIRTNFVDEAGILQDIYGETLLIAPQLEPVAARLVKSELRPGTANNDVNVIPIVGGGVKGYRIMRYLTSPYRWFLLTDVKAFIDLIRKPFEMDMFPDFDTHNLKVSCYERRGFFCVDPRGVWGEAATA